MDESELVKLKRQHHSHPPGSLYLSSVAQSQLLAAKMTDSDIDCNRKVDQQRRDGRQHDVEILRPEPCFRVFVTAETPWTDRHEVAIQDERWYQFVLPQVSRACCEEEMTCYQDDQPHASAYTS